MVRIKEQIEESQAVDRWVFRGLLLVGLLVPPTLLAFGLFGPAVVAALTCYGTLMGFLLWSIRLSQDAGTAIIVSAIFGGGG